MAMTSRRQFLSAAAVAATGGYMPSLWAAMKYDRKGVLDLFHLRSEDTEARVKAGVEENRKGPMLFTFKDKDGKILENVHLKVTQKTHDFRRGGTRPRHVEGAGRSRHRLRAGRLLDEELVPLRRAAVPSCGRPEVVQMKMIEFGQCRNVGDEIFMKRRWKRHFWGALCLAGRRFHLI